MCHPEQSEGSENINFTNSLIAQFFFNFDPILLQQLKIFLQLFLQETICLELSVCLNREGKKEFRLHDFKNPLRDFSGGRSVRRVTALVQPVICCISDCYEVVAAV